MRYPASSATQVACAVVLVCSSVPLGAQEPAPSRAIIAGEIQDSVRRLLSAAVADSAFPGAFAVVGDSRGILAEVGVGRIDWAARAPRPTRHTLWDMASLTKVMSTTTATAQLWERDLIDLDAPVQRYLPDWTGRGKERVTVRHLLTHTSGLPAFRPYDRQTKNRDSLEALLFATELELEPGARMVYSDIGAFVLGEIVEHVSGLPLDRYFETHIARPLRLRETYFNPPALVRARVAPTEIDTLRGGLVRGAVHDERAYYLGGVAAHAGLFSTGHDLARFATMMLRGGSLDGARILRPATIAVFTVYANPALSNRGLGWQKRERPEMPYRTGSAWAGTRMSSSAYGHTGFTGTSLGIDPERDLYVILLSNRVNPTRNNPRITGVRSSLTDAVVAVIDARRGPIANRELTSP